MIVTPRIAGRIAGILVVAALLQLSFFSHLRFIGAVPDFAVVVVVVLGLLGGAVLGAGLGFGLGLLLDALLVQTLGITSLVLLIAGYLAGRWREGFDITNSLTPPLVCGGLTVVAGLAMAGIQLTLGVDAPISLAVLPEIFAQGLLGIVLGAGAYPAIRRLLEPALIEEPGRSDKGVPLAPMTTA